MKAKNEGENKMNALDKLREMLDEAGIEYESHCRTYADMKEKYPEWIVPIPECDADRYFRNQIIYGRTGNNQWLFDAIFQYASHGREVNLIEAYGKYGADEDGNPMVMTSEEAFEIINRLEQERKVTK